jgi:hypothetical protein
MHPLRRVVHARKPALALTCSDKCRLARKRDIDILNKRGKGRIGNVERCPQCLKNFVVNGATQKYCCAKCRKRSENDLFRAAAKTQPATCSICGAAFLTSKNSKAKTCSPECLGRLRSAQTTERERRKKAEGYASVFGEFGMSCPWKTPGKLDSADLPDGVTTWACPEMDPMTNHGACRASVRVDYGHKQESRRAA